jgi:hypothetical protein
MVDDHDEQKKIKNDPAGRAEPEPYIFEIQRLLEIEVERPEMGEHADDKEYSADSLKEPGP